MGPHCRSGSGVVHHEFEPDRVTEAVVRAVSASVDADPLAIEPLYESVDPDALEALVRHGGPAVTITFEHEGVPVEVCGAGTIRVECEPDR